MTRVLAALLLVTLAGCAGTTGPTDATGRAATPDRAATTGTAPPTDADVYAAAINRYLSGRENSFPDRRFPVVFLLDRLDPAAADPARTATGGTPLSPDQRQRIDALVDVTLTFVPGLDAATTDDRCRVVKDDGVYLALGPAEATGADTAQVAVHGFVACMGATWFTYTLRRDSSTWTVTGTTGPMAIS